MRNFYCTRNATVICHALLQALVKISWPQKRRGKFPGRQKNGTYIPIHHETLKRKEREAGKGLKKVANRVVDESFENSRKVSLSSIDPVLGSSPSSTGHAKT